MTTELREGVVAVVESKEMEALQELHEYFVDSARRVLERLAYEILRRLAALFHFGNFDDLHILVPETFQVVD
jgi:hypothetical protein